MSDYSELKRLAEAATPGRNFDRLPMAGGGLKYECTGDDGSLVLKVDHKNDEWGFVGDNGQADEEFFLACAPSAVVALIAENDRLRLALESCADDLEAQVIQCYHGQPVEEMHPVTRRSFDRDMACAVEARAAMSMGEKS